MSNTSTSIGIAEMFPSSCAPKVYSYARFSTPEQAKGDSYRRQTEAAARWAARRGLVLDDSLAIFDEGVSAFRGANALDGGLSLFLDACNRGLIERGSFFLVESLDRISRMAPRKAQRLFDQIVDAGVTIVTLNDDQEFTADRLDNDPTALLIALMVSWRAHEESRTKARRLSAVWAEKRRKVTAGETRRLTTRGPSWLVPEGDWWREDVAKADIVRRIFKLTLAGEGEHRIARRFNEEGVQLLGSGMHWHRSTIAKVLRNPSVIGTLIPGRIDVIDGQVRRAFEAPVRGAYPAVIAEGDWLAVRALKDGRSAASRGRHAGSGVTHLLAGLARCPTCGAAMVRVMKGAVARAGRPKLVCSRAKVGKGCPYVSVPIHRTEEALLHDWGALFADVPAGEGSGELDTAYSEMANAILGLEDLLSDLADAMERSPSSTGARRIAKIEGDLRLMRGELEEIDERRRLIDKGLLRARLDDFGDMLRSAAGDGQSLDYSKANAALKVLFSGVTVDHRSGELQFHWRQGGLSKIVFAWVE